MPYKSLSDKSIHNRAYGKFYRNIKNPQERREFSAKNCCEICGICLNPAEKYFTRNKYNGLIMVCVNHTTF